MQGGLESMIWILRQINGPTPFSNLYQGGWAWESSIEIRPSLTACESKRVKERWSRKRGHPVCKDFNSLTSPNREHEYQETNGC